jgi:hypothetical protein
MSLRELYRRATLAMEEEIKGILARSAASQQTDAGLAKDLAAGSAKSLADFISLWEDRLADVRYEANHVLANNETAAMVALLVKVQESKDDPAYSFLEGWIPPEGELEDKLEDEDDSEKDAEVAA